MSAVVPSECRVALLAGGTSGEREISIASGEGAKAALEEAGFPVEWIDPANKEDLKRLIDEDWDVAFLCLHGKKGEDGTVQGMLEMLDIPYTCSGVLASALAMDKALAKETCMEEIQSPSPVIMKTPSSDSELQAHLALANSLIDYPCVVKPATEGSALGVEIVQNFEELSAAVKRAFALDSKLIVEKFITGVEVTVAVLGNDEPQPLPVIEIVPAGEFYDFDSKYAPGGSKHICPARLDEQTTGKVQHLARRAHQLLGCSGVSRSDFIIDAEGQPWYLETNTIPGMTATSLLPDAARAAGMSFPEMCTKLIEFALER